MAWRSPGWARPLGPEPQVPPSPEVSWKGRDWAGAASEVGEASARTCKEADWPPPPPAFPTPHGRVLHALPVGSCPLLLTRGQALFYTTFPSAPSVSSISFFSLKEDMKYNNSENTSGCCVTSQWTRKVSLLPRGRFWACLQTFHVPSSPNTLLPSSTENEKQDPVILELVPWEVREPSTQGSRLSTDPKKPRGLGDLRACQVSAPVPTKEGACVPWEACSTPPPCTDSSRATPKSPLHPAPLLQ